jgi:hypothetical protein
MGERGADRQRAGRTLVCDRRVDGPAHGWAARRARPGHALAKQRPIEPTRKRRLNIVLCVTHSVTRLRLQPRNRQRVSWPASHYDCPLTHSKVEGKHDVRQSVERLTEPSDTNRDS